MKVCTCQNKQVCDVCQSVHRVAATSINYLAAVYQSFPWETPDRNNDPFGFKSPRSGNLTFLSDYIREYFTINGISEDNFPLLVSCPECQAAVTASCTEPIKDGFRFVNHFHGSRIEAAKVRLIEYNVKSEKA